MKMIKWVLLNMPYKDKSMLITHASWRSMRSRCKNKPHYKGVKICNEWNEFKNFIKDMGLRPVGTVLDRKNNLLGYCPENCRWATYKESTENRKCTVRIGGFRVNELEKMLKTPAQRIYQRASRGWTLEEMKRNPKAVYNGGLQKQFLKYYARSKKKTAGPINP